MRVGWTVAVDESIDRRYLLAGTFVWNGDVANVWRSVVALTANLPGWRHMSRQSEARKIQIVTLITSAAQHSIVYDAGGDRTSAGRRRQRAKRDRCLWALADDVARKKDDVRLVLDSTDTAAADRQALYHALRARDCDGRVSYGHLPEQSEPLILIADAVAWCYAKGGLWPGRLGVAAERRDV